MARRSSPEPRSLHESALIGDELHVFGGRTAEKSYFPRNEIWTCNVREEKRWVRRLAEGKNIPPPCHGARCIVIDGIMYSYGGAKEGGGLLGEVFGLEPKKMKWIKVATPPRKKHPCQRSYCCLWAIGRRMIMFGGVVGTVPQELLQSGAETFWGVNNEIYEFHFEEGREKGYWLDAELSGERPVPRSHAAMEAIDECRGLLHGGWGGWGGYLDDAFAVDLRNKKWICINFLPKPSARSGHQICRLVKRGFEEKNIFVLFGGSCVDKSEEEDSGYVLDFDKQKSYEIDLTPDNPAVLYHTLHCVAGQDGSAHLILSGGNDRRGCKKMLRIISLGPLNKFYMRIEALLLPRSTSVPSSVVQRSIRDAEQRIEKMREQYEELQEEMSECVSHSHDLQRQLDLHRVRFDSLQSECRKLEAEKLDKVTQCRTLEAQCQSVETEKNEIRILLHDERQSFQTQRQALELQCQGLSSQRQTLQDSLEESRRSLDQFLEVLSISPQQIHLTEDKLGTGAYSDVFIGDWHGMQVAVKKFHDLITTERTIPLFQSEVLTASRLHHPNIVRVCGAIVRPGLPFQIITELLEGSVSEVIDAAHLCGSYLSNYEQLSIAVDMTSAITYLHELYRRPYVHGDIRPTNVLVTMDMRAKVADLGSAHLLDSSRSSGPMSALYVAPERLPPTGERSSLSSDVYSLGVSLIEIFTGVGPIPAERSCQLSRIMNRAKLHAICLRMTAGRDRVRDRPSSGESLQVIRREIAELQSAGFLLKKRLVKGKFVAGEENRRHVVTLSDILI
ncbi:uncharacterized protein [Oscarella lobularis]